MAPSRVQARAGRAGATPRTPGAPPPPALAAEAAEDAGLRYADPAQPGIRRRRAGKGFAYLGPDRRPVRDAATLARIRKLAIPPAWTDVWISPDPRGHLQAVGRDARGRRQYRYHDAWRRVRDEAKYDRLLAFGRALPRIRRRVAQDLRRPGLPRGKVLAVVVRLLEETCLRVGNHEYRRANDSYGLTTLRDEHARSRGGKVVPRFRGKGGKEHEAEVEDPRLARIVRACQALPGQPLFQYVDRRGRVRDVGSADVNRYLREASGEGFTAKDFRTWTGTVAAARALADQGPFASGAEAQRNVVAAVERVAGRLGNTPAVSRKAYIHPAIVGAYLDGSLLEEPMPPEGARAGAGLRPDERFVLRVLARRRKLGEDRLLADALRRSLRRLGHLAAERARKAPGRRGRVPPRGREERAARGATRPT